MSPALDSGHGNVYQLGFPAIDQRRPDFAMSIFEPIRKFRRQLDAGQRLIGAGVTFSDPLVTEALAPSVDFLWIDLEHTPLGPEALAGHLLAGRAAARPVWSAWPPEPPLASSR